MNLALLYFSRQIAARKHDFVYGMQPMRGKSASFGQERNLKKLH